jgi:hypothetical protein
MVSRCLMGWIGQMVIAHFHHIGTRLLVTVYRGDEDQTQPQELLEARLSWFTVFAFTCGVAIVTSGLLGENPSLVARGSIFGFCGWIAMSANVVIALLRAKS